MTVELLTEHHLEFLSLKGGCTGLSESMLLKMPHFWKSHVTAHIYLNTSTSLNCRSNMATGTEKVGNAATSKIINTIR